MFRKTTKRNAGSQTRKRRLRKIGPFEVLDDRRMMAVVLVEPTDRNPDDEGCGPHGPELPFGENYCNTIQNAVDNAHAGDEIILRPHFYSESVLIDKMLSIRSDGGRSTVDAIGGAAITIAPGVSFVGLDGLNLTGGAAGVAAEGVGSLALIDVNSIGNADHAVLFSGTGELTIVEGEYSGSGRDGIVIDGASKLKTINVLIEGNDGHGIFARDVGAIDLDGSFLIGNLIGGLFDGVTGDVKLLDTNFVENRHDGAVFKGITGDVEIETSNADGNGGDGLLLDGVAGAVNLKAVNAQQNFQHGIAIKDAKNVNIKGGKFIGKGRPGGAPAGPACGGGPLGGPNGIHLDTVGDVDLRHGANPFVPLVVNNSAGNGLFVRKAGDITITGKVSVPVTFDNNGFDGIALDDVGDIRLTHVQAKSNGLAGACVIDASSVSDTHGLYETNNVDGIHLRKITGSISLENTTSNGNDRNGNLVGDGLYATTVGGNVKIVDAEFDNGPLGEPQQNGIVLLDVKGKVEMESPKGRLSASANNRDGVNIDTVGSGSRTASGDVKINEGVFILNGRDGINITDVEGVEIDGSVASLNLQDGIDINSTSGVVEILNTTTNANTLDGIHVFETTRNVEVNSSVSNSNGDDGIEVDKADMDVFLIRNTTLNNTSAGHHVRDVKVRGGLATDFKITVDRATSSGNAIGANLVDSERALVKDSTITGNNLGIFFGEISDDVTVRRTDVSRSTTDGISMEQANDVNLQFVTADSNGRHGVFATDGSTVHASGGSFSRNVGSGFDLNRVGDVSTYLAEISKNSVGLSIRDAGAVNFSDTRIVENLSLGFDIDIAARLTTSNLDHRCNGTVLDNLCEGSPSVAKRVPHALFTASTGDVVDDVQLKVESINETASVLILEHTRTIEQDSALVEVNQDDIRLFSPRTVTINGGDGSDTLMADDWSVDKPTRLEALTLNGDGSFVDGITDAADEITIGVSTETIQTVLGGDPTDLPGDKLTLNSEGKAVVDTGSELNVDGYEAIHYAGIERIITDFDADAPTVDIIDTFEGGAINEITILFSEVVSGFDLDDLRLTNLDDSETNLLPSDATLESSDGRTWTLGNLRDLTDSPGDYKLELIARDSAIADEFGNPLESGDRFTWSNVAGDSNGDGKFDSQDLIKIFQAGKYRTGEPATYAEGDWNQDGVFDERDLIFAFANGVYQP